MSILNYVHGKYFATKVEKLPTYVCHPVDMFEGKPVAYSSLETNYFTPLKMGCVSSVIVESPINKA